MDEHDVYIDDDFVEDDEVYEEAEPTSESEREKTLAELLPTDCIVLSMEGGKVDPVISVRGKFADLGEAAAFLRYGLARVQYFKHIQERS